MEGVNRRVYEKERFYINIFSETKLEGGRNRKEDENTKVTK